MSKYAPESPTLTGYPCDVCGDDPESCDCYCDCGHQKGIHNPGSAREPGCCGYVNYLGACGYDDPRAGGCRCEKEYMDWKPPVMIEVERENDVEPEWMCQ